jgi:hypothetical protein
MFIQPTRYVIQKLGLITALSPRWRYTAPQELIPPQDAGAHSKGLYGLILPSWRGARRRTAAVPGPAEHVTEVQVDDPE